MTAIPPTQLPNSSSYIQPQVITPNLTEPISSLPMPQSLNQPSVSITNTQTPQLQNLDPKRHRRSKHEQEGRIYQCECGKAYLSQPALNNHKKSKHPELNMNGEKRGRGRPRKYLPNMPGDFETNKYESFFNDIERKKDDTKTMDITAVVSNVFDFLFKAESSSKLFSHPTKFEENVLLNNLNTKAPISTKEKKDKTCDDVFYEYLVLTQDKSNETYFTLILKFVLLFRECFNASKSKKQEPHLTTESSPTMLPETLPELCNEFYTEFMENNNFFGITEEKEKNELIEIIQHFCIWLFRNEYTKSKLSLAQ